MSFEDFIDNSMNERQISAVRESPPQHVFAVVSWGRTATAWLAKALNSHPEIFAVHAANNTLIELGITPKLSGLAYLRALGIQGYAYKAAGDVHGIPRTQIAFLKKKLGGQFGAAGIVREPLARYRSYITFQRHFDFALGHSLAFLDQQVTFNGHAFTELSLRQRVEIHAARMLNEVVPEMRAMKVFRAEDVTAKPESLLDLVSEISCGKIAPDMAWAQNAVTLPIVNDMPRRKQEDETFPDEWTRMILKSLVNASAWQAYQALGYTVPDFI